MNKNHQLAECEALLFLHGEPLTLKKMGEVLKLDKTECEALLDVLEKELERGERGLRLVRHEDKVQLVTKPQFHALLESFMKKELSEDLTPASLEVLSVILYLGPISRSRIEYLRGVNSLFTLRSLLIRGLVERSPDPERTNSFLYKVSFETLKHLGLQKQDQLPQYEKFRTILESFTR
ncbi:MAG: SMC-Scp complex subunit ScpB [Patescibacteria group bacterium]